MDKIETILAFFTGKKTFIVGVAMMIVGVYQSNAEMIMTGVGLMTLRAAIK